MKCKCCGNDDGKSTWVDSTGLLDVLCASCANWIFTLLLKRKLDPTSFIGKKDDREQLTVEKLRGNMKKKLALVIFLIWSQQSSGQKFTDYKNDFMVVGDSGNLIVISGGKLSLEEIAKKLKCKPCSITRLPLEVYSLQKMN